jgi:hypothetical protein
MRNGRGRVVVVAKWWTWLWFFWSLDKNLICDIIIFELMMKRKRRG